MPVSERLDFSQPMNELGMVGEEQRKRLFPKNDYKAVNPYSATNKDAIADGDEFIVFGRRVGRGVEGGAYVLLCLGKEKRKLNKQEISEQRI